MVDKSIVKNEPVPQTIMFADVSGSSAIYKALGNVDAKRLIDAVIHSMRKITQAHNGEVVKTIGDEIMARFNSPADACRAAIEIQRSSQQKSHQSEQQLALRIGMDYGNTLVDGNDVFGDTVNDAACVAHIARANQLVVTQNLVDALPDELRNICEEFDRVNLKGDTEKCFIYRVIWEGPEENHEATRVMHINHVTQKINTKQLQLSFNNQIFVITPEDVPFIIGRDHRKAHLHIDSSLASRDHCQITLQRGKFVLQDHSTNGTYVQTPDQNEIYLRREEIPLAGKGTISIGRRAHQAKELTISYQL
ncbi:adenylate/guanylate cyclase domain-containing protein [Aurantivibrio plasticivorans]